MVLQKTYHCCQTKDAIIYVNLLPYWAPFQGMPLTLSATPTAQVRVYCDTEMKGQFIVLCGMGIQGYHSHVSQNKSLKLFADIFERFQNRCPKCSSNISLLQAVECNVPIISSTSRMSSDTLAGSIPREGVELHIS